MWIQEKKQNITAQMGMTLYIQEHTYEIYTTMVEGVNADLRHYIPLLARRSRCFARKLETLKAVLTVFVTAYNRLGLAKYHYRLHHKKGKFPFGLVDFI